MSCATLSEQSRDRLPRRSRAKAGEEAVGASNEITRGNDLSGTLQGAGGIGGLLARSDRMKIIPAILSPLNPDPQWVNTAYYHSDGNGNITALIEQTGLPVGMYQYDPFGNILAIGGLLANENKYRFSGKEWNDNAGLYYYGYRFYNPNLQRWMNRDLIEEDAGVNLYQYVYNSPMNYVDPEGLWGIQIGGLNFGSGDPSYAFDGGLDLGGYWGDVGDTFAGEAKGAGSELSFGLYKPCYTSPLQRQGGFVGVGLAMAGETLGGWNAAGNAAKWSGKEFSHFVPAKLLPGGRNGLLDKVLKATKLNGNYVNIAKHAVTDPARHQFFDKAWKAANPLLNPVQQLLNRVPIFPVGVAAAAAGGSAASNGGGGCQ